MSDGAPSAGAESPVTGGNAGGPAGPPAGVGAFYDPETASGRLGLAFKRAMVAVRRLRGRETQRAGQISYAQYGLLHGLAGACERSARELAEQTDLSASTVAQMLEHLEAAGLVRRTRSDQDRRVVLSVLTERGAELVGERQRRLDAHWRGALASFSEEELSTAAAVLERIASVFDSLSSDDLDT
ncbi:MarR family winged helix-turn-helix transcriptional regulator [Conexibacter sp. S30A1]|uniref:MarR family winged helix-turn-helix transcriptional regulator n=1 Tax=Conexibacter sp. S30A1 TaxID=2937800 RepID=UPI00200BD39C|nr:MarR family transcriptional regulator [Conexibacter sp. S30A1]